MGERHGPLIVYIGDPSDIGCVEKIKYLFSGIPGFILPTGKENPPDGHGKVIYFCPAFGIVWQESRWLGFGEHKIKMCPEQK